MNNDLTPKNTLVPLVLRLALGVVFVYHGVEKIRAPYSEWGANWASATWSQPPASQEDTLKKMEGTPDVPPETIRLVQDHVRQEQAKQTPPLPEALHSYAVQLLVAWGELIGGLALLLGLLTRAAAAGLLIIQLGAIWTVTGVQGFSVARGGGYEYNLCLLAMCLALILYGGGKMAIDDWYVVRRGGRKATQPAQAESPAPAAS
jgi:uncharacterized membrane protein YphA (DoxX/SURF4 family)